MYQHIESYILAQVARLARIARPQHKNGVKSLLATVALCIAPGLALAQSNDRWISDQFEVTLRTGKSTQQSIIRLLPSGTKVTVLEEDEESGYTRVRTSDGTEGWLLTRYLMSSQTARLQLDEIRKLSSDTIQLVDQNKQLKQKLTDAERRINELESKNRELSDGSSREWFIVGAVVVMFGLILGLIIPRIRWQRKSRLTW